MMSSWRLAALIIVLAAGGCASSDEIAGCDQAAHGLACDDAYRGYAQPSARAYSQPPAAPNAYAQPVQYAPPPPAAPPQGAVLTWSGKAAPVNGPYVANGYRSGGPRGSAAWSADDYHYRVGPGDELALRFISNPDMDGPVTVGPDGRGIFPLVSAVKVADMTVDQVNAVLSQAYGQILRHPEVQVLVSAYGAAQIYVTGEVKDPGAKPIKGHLSVGQAVVAAGGLTPTARTGKIAVIRQREGRLLVKVVDLKSYTGSGGDGDFAVLPGDLVFVPRSKIADIDLFVDQYIKGVLPFSTSLSYNINPVPY
jgi:protein involved in polysaccharide export with SLBB domain